MEYNSVVNYVLSLVPLHNFHNLQAHDLSHFPIKQAPSGLKRLRFEAPNRKSGIFPAHLADIYAGLLPKPIRSLAWATCLFT